MKFKNLSLRYKFGFTLIFLVIISSFFITYAVLKIINNIFHEQKKEYLTSKIKSINSLALQSADSALSIASLFSKSKIVKEAYSIAYTGNIYNPNSLESQEARIFLRKQLSDILVGFKDIYHTQLNLHFHLPPARSLVRLWRIKQSFRNGKWVDISDDISSFRNTVKDITSGKRKYIRGIEIGRGGFAIRGICPIYDKNKKIVGSVEVLHSFNEIFTHLNINKNDTYAVFMPKSLLNIATKLRDKKKYPIIENEYVLISKSKNFKINKMITAKNISSVGSPEQKDNLFVNYKNKFMVFYPINDYNDNYIGTGLIVSDISNTLYLINIIRLVFTLGFIFLILIFVGVIIFIFNYFVYIPLKKFMNYIKKFAQGDLSKDIYYASHDEIGKMINNVNKVIKDFRERFRKMIDIAINLANYSNKVSQSTQNILEGASNQAISIEMASTSIK